MTLTATDGVQVGEDLGVVDVGGSHLGAALVRWNLGRPVLSERAGGLIHATAGQDALLDELAGPLGRLHASEWVLALPGPFDYVRGRGDFGGVEKFGALAGVDLRAALSRRLGVPGNRVHFLNDAVAYGLGEWWGSPERSSRAVCLTLGTGVGSAFVVDGEPVDSGFGVPPHGWVHLLQVNGRPLEDTVSTRAIAGAYARQAGRTVDVRAIAGAARQGDAVAADVLRTAMRALGSALRPCLADFGADELVVGGSMSRAWDLLESPLCEGLGGGDGAPRLVRCSILLDDAPLLGAAWWFSRRR